MLSQKVLSQFGRDVVRRAKANLRRLGKVSSGRLYRSLKSKVKVEQDKDMSLVIEMEDYGEFQDQGVSGTKRKFNTPFKFRKQPPSRALDGWVVRKGIAPRDDKGKFMSRKSLTFLISRSLLENGIKPSLFLTKPFQDEFKKLPDEFAEAIADDFEELIKQEL